MSYCDQSQGKGSHSVLVQIASAPEELRKPMGVLLKP